MRRRLGVRLCEGSERWIRAREEMGFKCAFVHCWSAIRHVRFNLEIRQKGRVEKGGGLSPLPPLCPQRLNNPLGAPRVHPLELDQHVHDAPALGGVAHQRAPDKHRVAEHDEQLRVAHGGEAGGADGAGVDQDLKLRGEGGLECSLIGDAVMGGERESVRREKVEEAEW